MNVPARFSVLLSASLCLLSGFLYASTEETQRKPNIVLIVADDLGWTDLASQGSRFYQTPHLDRLAAQGMTFSNAYAAASNCAPSRASLMTGTYPPRHGIYTVEHSTRGRSEDRKLRPIQNTTTLAADQLTLAEVMRDSGYVTAHIGKWHLGADPTAQGFDLNIAGGSWGSPSRGGYHSPYRYPNCVQEEKGEYLTDRLGTEAVAFIEDHADRPFFLHFAPYSVHTPLQAKADLIVAAKKQPATQAHNHPTYAAMVKSLDENVGRILDKLEDLGLSDNTLLLFTSDNGAVWWISKQWPLRAGKGSYYEGGIRVPLLACWPGRIPPGARCDVPVSGIDFFPTFLEAAGITLSEPKLLDGVSLMPLLTQKGGLRERSLFWHFPIYLERYGEGSPETRDRVFRTRPGSVIRTGDWKLHEYFEDGGVELYHLKEDMGETRNLANEFPEKAHELHDQLRCWRAATAAPVPTEPNPEYAPSEE